MKNVLIYVIIIIIIIVFIVFHSFNSFHCVIENINYNENYIDFLHANCKKGICHDNLEKCHSQNAYVFPDGYIHHEVIKRKQIKAILNSQDKYKLLSLEHIFVPSMMNGTFCDIIYNTYYDYLDYNKVYSLNINSPKKIRIRHYHFQPGIYFEIKYKGGIKVRAILDDKFNLLEKENIDENYKEIVISTLNDIKTKRLKPFFQNTYKRLSFVYKRNPSMRITIDTNIEFFYNDIYHAIDEDILEFKVPLSVSNTLADKYLDEINKLAGTHLSNVNVSKPMIFLDLVGLSKH
jgi:hypothetical protein